MEADRGPTQGPPVGINTSSTPATRRLKLTRVETTTKNCNIPCDPCLDNVGSYVNEIETTTKNYSREGRRWPERTRRWKRAGKKGNPNKKNKWLAPSLMEGSAGQMTPPVGGEPPRGE